MDQIQLSALLRQGSVRIMNIPNELVDTRKFGVDANPLVNTGQKRGLPIGTAAWGCTTWPQRDVAWHVLVFASQSVEYPGAEAGSWQPRTGVHENCGHFVSRDIGVHRANDCQVVDQLAELWKDLTDFNSGIALLLELERRGHRNSVHSREGFAIILNQRRFG